MKSVESAILIIEKIQKKSVKEVKVENERDWTSWQWSPAQSSFSGLLSFNVEIGLIYDDASMTIEKHDLVIGDYVRLYSLIPDQEWFGFLISWWGES